MGLVGVLCFDVFVAASIQTLSERMTLLSLLLVGVVLLTWFLYLLLLLLLLLLLSKE